MYLFCEYEYYEKLEEKPVIDLRFPPFLTHSYNSTTIRMEKGRSQFSFDPFLAPHPNTWGLPIRLLFKTLEGKKKGKQDTKDPSSVLIK